MPTQEQRTAATKAGLIDATVGVLVDLGYAGASTTEICRRAGVSQGALFRHFPTKADLLAAAVEDLFPRILDRFRGTAVAPGAHHTPGDLVDLVIAAYTWPELLAAVELYAAARTDAALAAALGAVEPPHRARLHALAAELLPAAAGHPQFDGAVDVVVDAVQGATNGRLLVLDPAAAARALADLRATLVHLLTALAGPAVGAHPGKEHHR